MIANLDDDFEFEYEIEDDPPFDTPDPKEEDSSRDEEENSYRSPPPIEKLLQGEIIYIDKTELCDFPPGDGNRFKPYSDEKIQELCENIAKHGILQPLIVRRLPDGSYQIISGHNRRRAALLIDEIQTLPCVEVKADDDKKAKDILNAVNLYQRELLPSEKAFAYQRMLGESNMQGCRNDKNSTYSHTGNKLNFDIESVPDSKSAIYRLVALTELCDTLLNAVDAKNLGILAGGEIAKLDSSDQKTVSGFWFEENGSRKVKRELTQGLAKQIVVAAAYGELDEEFLKTLCDGKSKPKQEKKAQEEITIPIRAVQRFFPPETKESEVKRIIIEALREYYENHKNQT